VQTKPPADAAWRDASQLLDAAIQRLRATDDDALGHLADRLSAELEDQRFQRGDARGS
jgi:hypothetical protein